MKLPLAFSLSLLTGSFLLQGADTPAAAPKDPKDRISYAIGMNIGRSMKRDNVEVNSAMVGRGLADALGDAKPAMTDEEMAAAMEQFKGDMQQKMAAEQKGESTKNETAGKAFLEANKKKDGVKTLASGLQYKVVTEGKGPKPKASDTVVTNYRGTLVDGKEFDSSAKHGAPATFPVNAVIPGWNEALQLMSVGSKWQLFVPSNLAYGENGPPGIGPNATLIFDVELVSIQDPKDAKTAPAAPPAQ